ncbi:hypothetical protein ACFQXB_10015 [Plastorhodobacter daqingensis]|uniref:Uncharacterized protein n=1 Tax=Plastorhodobacter daqingensis TaxID=1387281 RepID=A0ABW2ULV9_9RHOB
MKKLKLGLLTALVSAMMAAFGLAGLGLAPGDPAAGPVLVIAPPWGVGPEAVVLLAGGRVLGMGSAPFAALADAPSAGALRAAGAWAVLDPKTLSFLCGAPTDT